MIVKCLSFGSVWWLRPGNQPNDTKRFTSRAALFNTTGFVSNSQVRRLWLVSGAIRINAGMHPEVQNVEALIGRCFESPGLERRGTWSRLLLGQKYAGQKRAEALLVCVNSLVVGRLDFLGAWHSQGVDAIAASARRGLQETLLLMQPGSTFRTEKGIWEATWDTLKLR